MALPQFFQKLQSKLGIKNDSNKDLWGFPIPTDEIVVNSQKYDILGYYQYMQNALLYTVIDKIASMCATVPMRLIKTKATTGEISVVKSHDILLRMKYPNSYQGHSEFIKELATFYLAEGNAYAKINFGEGFYVNNFNIMPAQNVDIVAGEWTDPVKAYVLDVNDTKNRYPRSEVIHWRDSNVFYDNGQQFYGMSKTKPLKSLLKSSLAGFEAKIKDFESGGVKGFIYAKDDDGSITPELGQDIINKITSGKRRIAFINEDAGYEDMGLSVAEMEVQNSLMADFQMICNAYGINAGIFETDASPDNMRIYVANAYTQVVGPMLETLADQLNLQWVRKVDPRLELQYDLNNVRELEELMLQRITYLNQGKEFMTKNEARDAVGLPRFDDEAADQIYIELGSAPIKDFNLDPMERNPMGTQSRQDVNTSLQGRLNSNTQSEGQNDQE